METIFNVLCGLLLLVGMAFGLNYEEVSVYVCIYLWPALCCLMALMVTIAAAYRWWKKNTLANTALTALSASVTMTFLGIARQFINYYKYYGDEVNSAHQIFRHCVNDINFIAAQVGSTYAEVDLYIYCYLFALIAVVMWLSFEMIYPKRWLLNRLWRKH